MVKKRKYSKRLLEVAKEEDSNSNQSTVSNNSIRSVDELCQHCMRNYGYIRWIQCNGKNCFKWFHCSCVRIYDEAEVDEFFCNKCCQSEEKKYKINCKVRTNHHRHDPFETSMIVEDPKTGEKKLVDVNDLPTQNGTEKFAEDLMKRTFKEPVNKKDIVYLNNGKELVNHFNNNGFYVPIIIKNKSSLSMKIPKDFSTKNILQKLNPLEELDVIDVHKQQIVQLTLQEFIGLLNFSKIPFNSISLELSRGPMSKDIKPPEIVNQINWAEEAYANLKDQKPAVEKYCLISMANSYTDWHIDFSGTSVWYHIVKGKKKFYFIKPTDKNLDTYERLETEDKEHIVFLPDVVDDDTFEITIEEGNTLLLPTGYIHAVWTPEDSLVFGGNFLSSYRTNLQTRIFRMEEKVGVEDKMKYPLFNLTHWLAFKKVNRDFNHFLPLLTPQNCSTIKLYYNLLKSFQNYCQYTLSYPSNLKSDFEKLKLIVAEYPETDSESEDDALDDMTNSNLQEDEEDEAAAAKREEARNRNMLKNLIEEEEIMSRKEYDFMALLFQMKETLDKIGDIEFIDENKNVELNKEIENVSSNDVLNSKRSADFPSPDKRLKSSLNQNDLSDNQNSNKLPKKSFVEEKKPRQLRKESKVTAKSRPSPYKRKSNPTNVSKQLSSYDNVDDYDNVEGHQKLLDVQKNFLNFNFTKGSSVCYKIPKLTSQSSTHKTEEEMIIEQPTEQLTEQLSDKQSIVPSEYPKIDDCHASSSNADDIVSSTSEKIEKNHDVQFEQVKPNQEVYLHTYEDWTSDEEMAAKTENTKSNSKQDFIQTYEDWVDDEIIVQKTNDVSDLKKQDSIQTYEDWIDDEVIAQKPKNKSDLKNQDSIQTYEDWTDDEVMVPELNDKLDERNNDHEHTFEDWID